VYHKASLEELDGETHLEMMQLASKCLGVLRQEYHPQGFNVGVNIGEAGGAGVLEHVHMHIVPRWVGDTNFMSAVGGTRVLPESLEDTHARIQKAWGRIAD
jgi:ATP adenylyltransferase